MEEEEQERKEQEERAAKWAAAEEEAAQLRADIDVSSRANQTPKAGWKQLLHQFSNVKELEAIVTSDDPIENEKHQGMDAEEITQLVADEVGAHHSANP